MLKRGFVIVSILFLSFMIIFYGYRLFYYYKIEHKSKEVTTLSSEIIINTEKLVEKEETFYFYGDVTNNYLYYRGIMYRIISFNDDFLTLIPDTSLTTLRYGIGEDYEQSDVKLWIENEYRKTLNSEILYDNEIKLMDLKNYVNIGRENSFLKSDGMWIVDGNKGMMLDKEGKINTPSSYQYFFGVRPIITIKNGNYIRGNGTQENPYLIENKIINTLEDASIGDYIKYKEKVYRVIDKENGVKVVSLDSIGQYMFSNSTVLYNSNSILYQYLNTQYLATLNQEDLILSKWNNGGYQTSYKETKTTQVSSYIGLLTIGDYFIHDIAGYTLANLENMIYTIQEDKTLYLVNPQRKLDIYPSFYLKKELEIVGGNGTKTSPYEVGVK